MAKKKLKVPKKVIFFLNGRPYSSPPPPLNCQAIKRRTFFLRLPLKVLEILQTKDPLQL